MRKEVADLIAWAAEIGFVNEGMDGRGHFRLRHSNGETYRVAATPSDRRGEANSKADMRRIAGVEHDGPKSGSYRRGLGRRQRVSHLADETEVAALREVRDLLATHQRCCDELRTMQQQQRRAPSARTLVDQLLQTEERLVALGENPPIRKFRISA